MRVLLAVAILSLGCSSSSTNNSADETGGSGGADAATGGNGSGGKDSGASGGASGSVGDASVPEGAAGVGGLVPCFTTPIVINEMSFNGQAGPDDEYLELYNPGPNSVNLGPFVIDYAGVSGAGTDVLWNGNSGDVIESKGFFLIEGAAFSGPSDSLFIANVTLDDEGGVRLRSEKGPVDAVAWGNVSPAHQYKEGNAATAPDVGLAIGRSPDGYDCDDNSFDFESNTARTPGEPNAF